MTERRKKAIIRRRIFITCCVAVLVIAIIAITAVVALIKKSLTEVSSNEVNSNNESLVSSQDVSSADNSSNDSSSNVESTASDTPQYVTQGNYTLNADYSRLILVNGENSLPEDYDYGWNLTTIDDKYHNGQLTQIDAGVWPYMKAMIEAAWADGVQLYVWSPYRSYETQNMLFQNQVAKVGDEDLAATVVARPGTSEHNTGLCADFNMASESFDDSPMSAWMQEHAADYGFILRFPKDKEDITGVIYESWHWRFVGINAAKEINSLGLTLEEYVEYKKLEPLAGLYDYASAE